MSRLQRHLRSLASLEEEEGYPRQTNQNRPHSIPASAKAQVRSLAPPDDPLNVYPAFQWKYNVDENSPWWRKLFFRYVWLPFARFSYCKMKIVPFQRLEPDGSLSWKEHQGVFVREEDAQREAAKYAYGGYSRVYFNAPEMGKTITGRSSYPSSTANVEYEREAAKEEKAETDKFKEVLREAQIAIDRFRSRAHHA
jgi:hypothetical protein